MTKRTSGGPSENRDMAAQAVLPWRICKRKRWTLVTGSTSYRPLNILDLPPSATGQNRPRIDLLSTGVDSYRQGSTGVIGLKTEILEGPGRQFLATIRHDPANGLSKRRRHPWPPHGVGLGKPHPKRRSVSSPCVNHYKIKGYDLVNAILSPSLCFFPVPVPLLSVTGNSGSEKKTASPFPEAKPMGTRNRF